MWTAFAGAPRPRARAPGAPHARDAATLVRRAWLASGLAGVAFVWAAGGILRALLAGRVDALDVARFGILPTAVLAVLLAAFSMRRRVGLEIAGAFAVAAATLAVAGHLLHPRGRPLLPFVAPGLEGPAWVDPVLLALALAAPFFAAFVLRAASLGLDHAGAPPLAAPDAATVARAYAAPGMVALDAAATLAVGAYHRATGRRALRTRTDADLDRLAQALPAHGWVVEARGWGLRATRGEDVVRIVPRSLAFPRAQAFRVLDVAGPRAPAEALHSLLENDLTHLGRVTSTRTAQRLEALLDAFHDESLEARTVEERAALLHALDAVDAALKRRPLLADEWAVLDWKSRKVRTSLQDALLRSEAHADAPEARPVLAPAPALAPDVGRVLDAGGLDAATRVSYVPYYVVAVKTNLGESEVALDALTERYDARESAALLNVLSRDGARLRVEATRAAFVPAPTPTAALVGVARDAVRARGHLRTSSHARDAELFYVPYVSGPGRLVNAVTGRDAHEELLAALTSA